MSVSIEAGVISRIENAGWDELHVEGLPAALQFIALMRLLGQPEEFEHGAQHTMEANLTGPGMEGLVHMEFDLPTSEPNTEHPAGWEMNAVIPVLIQFTATTPGTHMVDFYVDERYQQGRSIPFRIRVADESAPTS